MKGNSDFCIVAVGKIEDYQDNEVLPLYIKNKLPTLTNQQVINQKKAGYGLLRQLIKESIGFDEDFSTIYLTPNGKPICDEYYFSISHTNEVVAVAFSNTNIGIDIELLDDNKNLDALGKRILHKNEQTLSLISKSEILKLWVKKEGKFKFDGGKIFIPNNIDTNSFETMTELITYDNKNYWLCVVTNQGRVDIKNKLI